MAIVPPIHFWQAGDDMNALRMNEIRDQIVWLVNPPRVHVGRALTTQSLPTSSWNKISFDTLHSSDPYGMWDSGNPDKVTCTVPGWYTVEGVLCVSPTSTSERFVLGIYKNGFTAAEAQLRHDQQNAPSSGNVNVRKEFKIFLNVGDWLHLGEQHLDANTRTSAISGTWEHSQLRMRWVSN